MFIIAVLGGCGDPVYKTIFTIYNENNDLVKRIIYNKDVIMRVNGDSVEIIPYGNYPPLAAFKLKPGEHIIEEKEVTKWEKSGL